MLWKSSKVALVCSSMFFFCVCLCSSNAFAVDDNASLLCDKECNGNRVLVCHAADNVTLALPAEEGMLQLGECWCVVGRALRDHEEHGDPRAECATSPAS